MKKLIAVLCILCYSQYSNSQVKNNSELYKTLKTNDSLLFNVGFNTCNYKPFEELLAEDLEFYHDLGGIIDSKRTFINNFKNGLCKNDDYQSRRALIKGSLEVFPLYKTIPCMELFKKVHIVFMKSKKGIQKKLPVL